MERKWIKEIVEGEELDIEDIPDSDNPTFLVSLPIRISIVTAIEIEMANQFKTQALIVDEILSAHFKAIGYHIDLIEEGG